MNTPDDNAPLLTFSGPFRRAHLHERYKRFIVEADAIDDGARLRAHLADPGRLPHLMQPGRVLWLSGPYPPPRKLAWSVRFAELEDGRLVSMDSKLAERVAPALIARGHLPELPGPDGLLTEHTHGDSRFDLAWRLPDGALHLAEIKTVNLHHGDGLGGWPDAPSARGRKHLGHLIQHARTRGGRASLLFITGRDDIDRIRPEADVDPDFAALFDEALDAGVQVLGVRLRVTEAGAFFAGRVPVTAD